LPRTNSHGAVVISRVAGTKKSSRQADQTSGIGLPCMFWLQ